LEGIISILQTLINHFWGLGR